MRPRDYAEDRCGVFSQSLGSQGPRNKMTNNCCNTRVELSQEVEQTVLDVYFLGRNMVSMNHINLKWYETVCVKCRYITVSNLQNVFLFVVCTQQF